MARRVRRRYPKNIVACSGGKDSTCLALLLHEQGEEFALFWTPTGNEPPGVKEHIDAIASRVGAELIVPNAPTLFETIESNNMIPNFWARFCTRQIKIEPCIGWFKKFGKSRVLHVGLRADEEGRKGIYDELVDRRFLLRELDMDVQDVIAFNEKEGLTPPFRTDCMLCPFQGLNDWLWLWETHPEHYRVGVEIERERGHTFRSPTRDNWPAALNELAVEFDSGRRPRKRRMDRTVCRVCTL